MAGPSSPEGVGTGQLVSPRARTPERAPTPASARPVVPKHLDRVHIEHHMIPDRDRTAALEAEGQLLDSGAAVVGALVHGDSGERADTEPSRCRSPCGGAPRHRRVCAGSAAPAPAARKHPALPDTVPSPTPSPADSLLCIFRLEGCVKPRLGVMRRFCRGGGSSENGAQKSSPPRVGCLVRLATPKGV